MSVDYLVAAVGTARVVLAEIEARIAARVAALVSDGAVLHLGAGGPATAVASALCGHRGLRVHSGPVGDWLVDLDESGALVTGDGPPPVVAGTAMGTDRSTATSTGIRCPATALT
ncbi:hypothetical protein I4I73_32060 [Pseudonocardia sp. KRD-184]|uniref:6-phospho-3-hexuloisomerase n=1 Tax=Pseudonocardia oceani TaxID=2792013 RepID=A0ABS6U2V8_9PSEU|nr:hypothetical protein [Pseudonocardia oceani]MBW0094089.1 hypothetical protein [Pseudonocardia oceani]MBW0100621.1 hypothetical protein [Pseudonocardia oceani]MBW0112212.1 hypothetical protein [Pseudonocardia oceani]MBW0120548.1 hypothetical protein [Pseudonocardia oceani]MBW0126298.1 hypothetical protein [Pseudonocardia oceani]